MKKMFFAVAVAAIATVGCTKTDNVNQPTGEGISFKNSFMSRAALATGEFNIVSYIDGITAGTADYTTAKFTDTYNLATDAYTTPLPAHMYYYNGINSYWFYTYGDYATGTLAKNPTGVVYSAVTTPKIDFTATAGNVDLVTATTGEVTLALQNASRPLAFKHVLTKVRFTAKTDTYSTLALIKVKKIEYTVNTNTGTIDLVATPNTMTATGTTAVKYTITPATPITLGDLSAYSPIVDATNSVFYVVPQTLSAVDPLNLTANDAQLKITWVVNEGGVDGAEQTKTFALSNVMASNKQVNYQVTINLRTITFDATLDDWDTPEINVPFVTPIP